MAIALAIFLLGFLILIHELGHFLVAKRAGLYVKEFAIGFPPKIWKKKIGETLYSLNILPFGGFVNIYGESGTIESIDDKNVPAEKIDESRAFYNQPAYIRTAILLAGVFMNFIFGAILFAIIFSVGAPEALTPDNAALLKNVRVEVASVEKGSPADSVGIQPGDAIISISTLDKGIVKIKNAEQLHSLILGEEGKQISLDIMRGSRVLVVKTVPRVSPPAGEGALGIEMADVGTLKYPWYRAIIEGFKTAGQIVVDIYVSLYQLIGTIVRTGKLSEGLAGPIGVVSLAKQSVQIGWVQFVNFSAFISINLAALNVLPIPALDGGGLLFLVIEKIRGRRVASRYENLSKSIGMALLLALILFLSIHDVRQFL